ncbi:MAG: YigZ family protein [Candidatus Marinimicrobia bacterium]|nr:YigZ family protein [Candidatus Neomarinimicrobiota bacterium]
MKQIVKNGTYQTKIQNSKFIAYCVKVDSVEAVRKRIAEIEEEHRKANHVCWAYRIFQNEDVVAHSSDAGEPHCSAGPPILSAIEGRDLIEVVCIVVRYFGGIKLGIGGLIRAYGSTAGKALDESGAEEYEIMTTLVIGSPLDKYSDVMRILRKYSAEFQQGFDDRSITFNVRIPLKKQIDLIANLKSIPEVYFT